MSRKYELVIMLVMLCLIITMSSSKTNSSAVLSPLLNNNTETDAEDTNLTTQNTNLNLTTQNTNLNLTTQNTNLNLTTQTTNLNLTTQNTNLNLTTENNNISSVENDTNINLTTTVNETTMKPPLTTATTTRTTIPPSHQEISLTLKNFFCLCDLHFHFCDLNCCCDPDCTNEEKAIFSTCSDTPISSSRLQRSCHKSNYIFRNNTPFLMEYSKTGMFCIAYDNYKEEEELSSPKFQPGKTQLTSKYDWHPYLKKPHDESNRGPYKYKNSIKTLKTTSSGAYNSSFVLPSSFHGHDCLALESISFLEDTKEVCIHQVYNFPNECKTFKNYNLNTFLNNTFVIGNPAKEFSDENLIEIIVMTCDSSYKCTKLIVIKDPFYDETSSTCYNVLQRLDITFVHNGIEGIEYVFVKILLANYSIDTKEIIQTFQVNFIWAKTEGNETYSNNSDLVNLIHISRSGNPGYIYGKPVVMGAKVIRAQVNTSTSNKSQQRQDGPKYYKSNYKEGGMTIEKEEIMLLNSDSNKWMTVLSPGHCNMSKNRKPVLFGMNINTICAVNVTEYKSCQELQLVIGTILLGIPPENFTDRYVSSFGNPNFDDIKDWIPVLTSESPFGSAQNSFNLVDNGCAGITTSMHIQIAYAYVGSVQFPQATILGVLYEFGKVSNLMNKTLREEMSQISISTTVGFADITTTSTTKIAEWPILSVQLPPDFFYPFSWSSSSALSPLCKKIDKTLIIFLSISIMLYF